MNRMKALRNGLEIPASQVLQSLTSFISTLAFAHMLSPDMFGIVAAFWLVWMLVLSLNRTVFGEQLLADQQSARSVGYGSFMVLELLALTGVSVIVGAVIGGVHSLPGILYIATFVASDAVRYWYMHISTPSTDSGGPDFIWMETFRLFVSIAVLGIASAYPGHWWIGFVALASSSAWIVWASRKLRLIRLSWAWSYLRSKGKFELLMLIQFLLVSSIAQVLPLFAVAYFSASVFGGMRLTQNIVAPAMLVATAFQPYLIRRMAGEATLQRVRSLAATMGISLIAGALLVFVSIYGARSWGALFLPDPQLETVKSLIVPAAVGIASAVIGQPGGALLRVMRLGGVSLAGQVVGVLTSVILALDALERTAYDFMWALTLGNITTVAATYLLLAVHLCRRRLSRVHADNGRVRGYISEN